MQGLTAMYQSCCASLTLKKDLAYNIARNSSYYSVSCLSQHCSNGSRIVDGLLAIKVRALLFIHALFYTYVICKLTYMWRITVASVIVIKMYWWK